MRWLFLKLKTFVKNSNSLFFVFWGSIFLVYLVLAYTLPVLDMPKYSGVTQNLLVPILVIGVISSYLLAGVVGYISSGGESGYVVPGFVVWLLITGIGSYAFIHATDGMKKATPQEERAESKQEVITKNRKSLVQPLIDIHKSSNGGYQGLCQNLPELEKEIRSSFKQKFWQTMKCEATAEAYALSFGDAFTETDWRWCMDSSGFAGQGNLNRDNIRCE